VQDVETRHDYCAPTRRRATRARQRGATGNPSSHAASISREASPATSVVRGPDCGGLDGRPEQSTRKLSTLTAVPWCATATHDRVYAAPGTLDVGKHTRLDRLEVITCHKAATHARSVPHDGRRHLANASHASDSSGVSIHRHLLGVLTIPPPGASTSGTPSRSRMTCDSRARFIFWRYR
jgi:hypothetical protein